MFKTWLCIAALSLCAALPSYAQTTELFWDRLDRLIDRSDWERVSQSDIHRRIRCTNCVVDVSITISVSTLPDELKSRYTLPQAVQAYREDRCRKLVQQGTGRCVREGLVIVGTDTQEQEAILPYGDAIIWGHLRTRKNHTIVGTYDWMQNLMKSLTPLY